MELARLPQQAPPAMVPAVPVEGLVEGRRALEQPDDSRFAAAGFGQKIPRQQ
jgi:hypothetical protein